MSKMKALLNPIKLLVVVLGIAGGILLYSCNDTNLENNGDPVIYYIRNTDPARSDSLYVGAPLGNLIAVVGANLGGTTKIMVNDHDAALNSTYITDTSILVNVPPDAPIVRNDKMVLTFKNGGTLEYPFKVDISAPIVASMENEWAKEGEEAVIRGNYFFPPLSVKLADGTAVTPSAITQTEIRRSEERRGGKECRCR